MWTVKQKTWSRTWSSKLGLEKASDNGAEYFRQRTTARWNEERWEEQAVREGACRPGAEGHLGLSGRESWRGRGQLDYWKACNERRKCWPGLIEEEGSKQRKDTETVKIGNNLTTQEMNWKGKDSHKLGSKWHIPDYKLSKRKEGEGNATVFPSHPFQLLYFGTLQFETHFLRTISQVSGPSYVSQNLVAALKIFCKNFQRQIWAHAAAKHLGNSPPRAHPPGPGK